ncbi:MAG: DUF6334 family protein [Methyloligellaceae bacterium]
MKGFEQLSDALHAGEEPNVLRSVYLVVRHSRVEDTDPESQFDLQAIALQFDRFSVSMVCEAELDQVELLVDEQVQWPDMVITDISDDLPWEDIIDDHFLGRSWKMTNDMGYNDAIQLTFMSVDRDDPREHIIQFEAVASRFYISRLDWGTWNYDPLVHIPDD